MKDTAEIWASLYKDILSDNGTVFTSKDFMTYLDELVQQICFAGVDSHHQNGHAETSIRSIMAIT